MVSELYVATSLRRPNLANAPSGVALIPSEGADTSRDGLFRVTLDGANPGSDTEYLGFGASGGIRTPVVVDNENADIVYCATNRAGVFRSKDHGATWTEVNDGIIFKEIWSLAQHPRTGELYAGTGPGSVFKSSDRGDSWQECDGLNALKSRKSWTFPGPPFTAHVKGIGLHAADPSQVWGAIEVGWIIRSLDGGQTWENLRHGESHDSHFVLPMPDNPDIVVSTAGNGVFRSEDGGGSFIEVTQGLERKHMVDLVVHPDRPNVLFSAATKGSPRGWKDVPMGADSWVYRSEDQGKSWERLTQGLPDPMTPGVRAICGDRDDPDVVMVGFANGTVWGTFDGGKTFELVVEGLPPVSGLTIS
jgi:photosystem II stability/assembly factor-like uncharacterized protein